MTADEVYDAPAQGNAVSKVNFPNSATITHQQLSEPVPAQASGRFMKTN